MKRKVYKILPFVLALIIFISFPIQSYAGLSDGCLRDLWGYTENADGTVSVKPYGDMTLGEIWDIGKQFISFGLNNLGCYFSGSMNDILLNYTAFDNWMKDRYINGYNGTKWNCPEYFDKEVKRNADGTFTISDKFMDDIVAYSKKIIDDNTGYFYVKTLAKNNIPPSMFVNKDLYDTFCDILKENKYTYCKFRTDSDISFEACSLGDKALILYRSNSECDYFDIYDKTWNKTYVKTSYHSFYNNELTQSDGVKYLSLEWNNSFTPVGNSKQLSFVCSLDGDYIKVFKTLDAFKDYNAGYQPFYTSPQYIAYDSSIDNSVTVKGDYFLGCNWESNNNTYYNNISNTVINNYSDGISEEQLNAIIEKILAEIRKNGGNGGNNSGSGSGSSGGGLSGFLSGLGSIGDALLSILGKLMEYVGKAIELFSDTIVKVIDIIPKKFTELLTALFPFIPEEFLIAIQLMLALGVVLAILKAVKK